MDNIPKSRRIGGKGTPRIPPKKTKESASDILDQTLLSHKKNTTKVETTAAIITSENETITFAKPEMNAILCGKKEAICYIVRGKGEVVQQKKNTEDDVPDDFEKAAKEMLNKAVEEDKIVEEDKAVEEEKAAEENEICTEEEHKSDSDKNKEASID